MQAFRPRCACAQNCQCQIDMLLSTQSLSAASVVDKLFNMQVVNFPFPAPPPGDALRAAEATLIYLSALQATNPDHHNHSRGAAAVGSMPARAAQAQQLQLSQLGRSMAAFPIAPRAVRIIIEAADLVATGRCKAKLLAYAVALAAAMCAETPFALNEVPDEDSTGQQQQQQVCAGVMHYMSASRMLIAQGFCNCAQCGTADLFAVLLWPS